MSDAQHKIQITLDESTGAVSVVHRCWVTLGGHTVSHAREVELAGDTAAALKSFIDSNREAIQAETTALAIRHVAAITNKVQPGVIPLKVGGTLAAIGAADAAKEPK